MIRTILTFAVSPDVAREVERIYADNDVLAYSLAETRAEVSELSIALDPDEGGRVEVVITAVWPDEQAYQEWLDHPNRAGIAPGLPELVGVVGVARRYRVRQRATAHRAADGKRLINRNIEFTSSNPSDG